MNQRRLINILLSVTLIISLTLSCKFSTSISPVATPTPNPLTVQVKADEQLASSAVISTTGGTLTAQAADGTMFTLTFPEGALLSDEEITLTPVSSVEGLPFSSGLVGGVQMAPEGLRLFQPATLTIESPKTVAAEGFETVAFGYHQNGEGLYLNPSTVSGNTLTLEIWHFSGEGAAQATPAEIQTQQQRVPSNLEDAFTQRMQEYLSQERQSQLLGEDPDPEFGKKMSEFLREAYDSFIAPQLPIALQDCEAARPIFSKALSWLRQVQLLGYDNEFQSESALIMETMNQAIVNCYNKEYDQCVIDNDIKHRIAMLGFLRQASLLGIADQLDQSKIEKCPKKMSFQASGGEGTLIYSGEICDLEQPFTLNVNGPYYEFTIQLVPSGPQAGSFTYSGTEYDGAAMTAVGTYTVNGAGADAHQLILDAAHITSSPIVGPVPVHVIYHIDLVPLDTQECSNP